MKTIKWGIIGCGNVCEKKAGPALQGVDNSELVAVMRRDETKARDFARRHGVPRAYGSLDTLLQDPEVDYIYNATSNPAHHQTTLAALKAGKPVLVEKEMGLNAAECDDMISCAEEMNLTLAVAFYRRGYPTILRARELVEQGAIGKLQSIYLNDEFPLSHRLDLLHFFAGDVASIEGKTENLPPCSKETKGTMLYCHHHNGVVGYTPTGWDENLVPETLDLRGTKGRILVLDLKGGLLVWHNAEGKHREEPGPLPATHWGLIDNFVKAVNGKAELCCDGREGRKSTVLLDYINQLPPDSGPLSVDYQNPIS
ncbi:MAG: Gfo/Idh/MocA family oxidoreductase [Opitutales bacterium]|nr:Gfo/Idh/MocA family oxidoreductase [Opitutales bacterium]